MNYNIEIMSFHKGFCIIVQVANNIVLILQLNFDKLFGEFIEQLSPME
jgi:hypothetical protein